MGRASEKNDADLLREKSNSCQLFVILESSNLLPTVNDFGNSGIAHISDHGE
jgi:hypothetical protein